ncbi:MAG: sugar ABC transporter ATP-binding protein [Planctomycetota bacterium]|nr:sugar ABC transporter ATP-binding protein [Planctomycetota bacterium]
MNGRVLLAAERVSKHFGGVVALQDVSFDVREGEIHAICGENGAGKSTLIKLLSGQFKPGSYTGQLRFRGEPIVFRDVRDAEAAGIAVIHQELALVESLSVAENLFLGRLPQRAGRIDWPSMLASAREVLERVGADLDPEMRVADLGMGQKQLVEITRALSRQPRLLILDEPTAALGEEEVETLTEHLDRLRRQGVAAIYISHKLGEILALADRVTVLRDGSSVRTQDVAELTPEVLIEQMVGRELREVYPPRGEHRVGGETLCLEGLSARAERPGAPQLRNISLSVRRGEIVGIGGLMGAGRTELVSHLYGLWGQRLSGTVTLNGRSYRRPSPRRSLARGMMLVTEDRQRWGLVAARTVDENLSLSSHEAISKWGWVSRSAEQARNSAVMRKLNLRSDRRLLAARQLSGGNQQKVVVGRGLLSAPDVILLDEPTRGIDVSAKRELYEEVRRLAAEGKAILWVSSELPELMGMSDRIAMMRAGAVAGLFEGPQFDARCLMAAATGQAM